MIYFNKILCLLLLVVLSGITPVWANGDKSSRAGVAPVNNKLYADECGACHFAYQPGLLPARSWKKLLASLDDHFGDNAELDAEDLAALGDYLNANSADRSNYKRSKKIRRSLSRKDVPLRITEVPYIINKHDEIPRRMIKDNPKVQSLSRCDACHTNANRGSFSERQIDIPGFGRWED